MDDRPMFGAGRGFLVDGGTMGALMRGHDWKTSPLGAPETWPQSLRSVVGLLLTSKFPMFVAWGPELGFLYNDTYAEILGAKHPAALGARIHDIWAEIWPDISPLIDAALAGEATYREDLPLLVNRHGLDEQAWFTFSYSPVRDESGQVAGMFCAVAETTDKVLSQLRANTERDRLARMFEQTPGFIALLEGPEHRIQFTNPAYQQLIGHRDVVGKTVAEALPDAVAQGYVDLLDGVVASGKAHRSSGARYAVQAVPCGPIDERIVDFVYQPVVEAGGRVSGVFVNGYDVTQAYLEAEERTRVERELDQRERELELLTDALPVLVSYMDVHEGELRYQFLNKLYEEWFPRRREELQGRLVREVVGETAFAAVQDYIDRALAGERLSFEQFMPYKEGQPRHIRTEYVPRFAADGRVEGIYALVQDVSDAKQAEAALRQLNEELESRVTAAVAERERTEAALRQSQKLEAVGQLTGGVAHDFNNLLTIIRSSVEFLRRPNLPEERRRRYIDAITGTVDRAAKLTGQLLAFARRQALKPEVFDVPERIQAVTDMLRTIVGSRIRIEADTSCERCFVEADVTQFETALVNMAVNARDAMDGEGTLTVHVDARAGMPSIRGHAGGPGKFVAVSISDTGSGIPVDKLGQIFEPFFTTKEVGKGTGLGLSQVYGFAKQSGGDVAVESELGKGTTFTLYLPKVEREAGADETAGNAQGGGQHEDGRGCRVLVVEDNLEVGQFATQLLQDLGYETTWAANATEALDLLEKDHTRFDVMFSDVVMPGMSGIELGREIRQRYPALPVVLTSGYSHVLAEEGRHGFELLHKPYAVEEVSRVLRRVTRKNGAG
jgi:PAS domain S-box-containing protein